MLIKIVLLVVFFSVMIAVGLYSRKHATDVNGFVLGGRSVGPWLTAFAYGTTYFSAVVFVGYAGQFGWKYGISATWIGVGNAFLGSLLAWIVLGSRTRALTKSFSSATMADFFGKRFQSHSLKIAASIIVFVFLIPYTASVYNGLSKLFSMAFNIPFTYCVIGMAVLTGIYVILGGYMATAINDFIQGIIMLVGIVLVVMTVLNTQGGLMEAITKLDNIETGLNASAGTSGSFASIFGPDPINLLGVVILTSLGTWGMPQMIHKFYTIKDNRSIKIGAIISTVFAIIISGGCYFLGSFARLFDHPSIYSGDKVLYDSIIPYMLQTCLPDILIGVVLILVLSASMSTLSSLVITSSSTITLDFIKDTIFKKMSEKTQLLVLRCLIVVFIIISVIMALDPPDFIAQLIGISWGALAGSFLAPFIYSLYWKGTTKLSVWASFISAVGIMVANQCVKNVETTNHLLNLFKSSINAGALAMLAGLIIVPVVSLITPKLKKEFTDTLFDCYKKES